jgi:hypothetical protein
MGMGIEWELEWDLESDVMRERECEGVKKEHMIIFIPFIPVIYSKPSTYPVSATAKYTRTSLLSRPLL